MAGLAGCATENVSKLSFASERMQAAERAYNFVVGLDFCLQTTSTVVECYCDVDIRFDLCRQTHTPVVDADKMSNSRHSPSLISIFVGVDHRCCRMSKASRISS